MGSVSPRSHFVFFSSLPDSLEPNSTASANGMSIVVLAPSLSQRAMPPGQTIAASCIFLRADEAAGMTTRGREALLPATAVEAWDERWAMPEGRADWHVTTPSKSVVCRPFRDSPLEENVFNPHSLRGDLPEPLFCANRDALTALRLLIFLRHRLPSRRAGP